MTDTAMTKLDRIETLLREHIVASANGRMAMQVQIDDALSVTTEIKSTVKGLSLLGKVSSWVGGLALAAASVIGLWQLLAPGANGG